VINKYQRNINFAQSNIHKINRPKKKRGFFYKLSRLCLICFVVIFIILFMLSYKAIFSQETLGRTLVKLPVVSQIKNIFGAEDTVITQDADRINFLLMGIGGSGHEGALLTDTMMLASIKLSTNQIALISIPRDLLVEIPGNGWQRINHASAYGEINKYPGGGSALAAETVEKTFGIPIHYWLRIDFSGFEKVIDSLGGIDVEIERSFTDNQYPTEDFKVQTISFEQGIEHMNGDRALKFARSRHGDNWEGSDFARSKRQQKILMAVKDKVLNWKTIINPNRLYNIFNQVKNHTETNIESWQLPELAGILKNIDFNSIEHYIIDDSPGGLLKPIITPEGAAVLAPKSGDLSELNDFVANIFVVKNLTDRKIEIIIANGTDIEGLATYTGSTLSSWGFTISRLVNSPRQDFEKTVIYDLSNGQEKEALKIIKNRLNTNASSNLPEFLQPLLYKNNQQGEQIKIEASFLIVTGSDQKKSIEAIEQWQAEQNRLSTEQTEKENINEKTDNQTEE